MRMIHLLSTLDLNRSHLDAQAAAAFRAAALSAAGTATTKAGNDGGRAQLSEADGASDGASDGGATPSMPALAALANLLFQVDSQQEVGAGVSTGEGEGIGPSSGNAEQLIVRMIKIVGASHQLFSGGAVSEEDDQLVNSHNIFLAMFSCRSASRIRHRIRHQDPTPLAAPRSKGA